MTIKQPKQVIVAGLPRSGTTWLAKILDSHPQTLYQHEPDIPPTFPSMPLLVVPEQYEAFSAAIKYFASGLNELGRVRTSATLPVFKKNNESIFNLLGRKVVCSATKLASTRLGNIRVPQIFSPPEKEGMALVWKTVDSVGRLGLFSKSLAPVKVVLILRHPCGVINSITTGIEKGIKAPTPRHEIDEIMRFESDLVTQVKENLQKFDLLELEAFKWAVLNSYAIESLEDNPDATIIRYEDLVSNPLEESVQLFDKLEMPSDSQVERFIQKSTNGNSSRYYGVYRKKAAVNVWKDVVPLDSQERVAKIVSGTKAAELYL